MTAIDAIISDIDTIWQPGGATSELFPAMCKKDNGDLLRVSRIGTSHVSTDGDLVSATSSDNGVTWSGQSTLLNNANDLRAGIPRKHSSGKIMVSLWEAIAGSPITYKTYSMFSTSPAASAWDAPVQLPNHTAKVGNACESPIVEMPNGDLLLPVYESESNTGSTGWSTVLYKSTDDGASWAFFSYIGHSADSAAPPQANYEEPFLLRLANGELLCAIRQSETGWSASTLRYIHMWRSTDDGASWTDEGRIYSGFKSASRPAMIQTSDGAVILQFRILKSDGASAQGIYLISPDNGQAWYPPRDLDTSDLTTDLAFTIVYSYGDFIQLDSDSIAAIFCDEVPSFGAAPAIRFGLYDLSFSPTAAVDVGWSIPKRFRKRGPHLPV